ncbi:MAG: hypothetical protein KDB00_25035 [Planctomycetales bacterium]|nr:hypothetical protein [Planctomycetales bacterium]
MRQHPNEYRLAEIGGCPHITENWFLGARLLSWPKEIALRGKQDTPTLKQLKMIRPVFFKQQLLVLAALVLSLSSAIAQEEATTHGTGLADTATPSVILEEPKPEMARPTAWGEPTEVQVGIYVIDVDEVNSADQSFASSVYFQAQWNNPLLAHEGPGPKLRG